MRVTPQAKPQKGGATQVPHSPPLKRTTADVSDCINAWSLMTIT